MVLASRSKDFAVSVGFGRTRWNQLEFKKVKVTNYKEEDTI
jgi:hypothetical protein